ncbi:MAG: 2TM domain-containing protein [Chitinophagaceae bacterium]|jgi:hypothetical protein|nr:2TM domain-containing protein [Chitinophagaceae bacterium]
MTQYNNSPEGKDPELWEIAKKRASFKTHLITYVLVNAFLWAIWFFSKDNVHAPGFPWPIWTTLGWGIGLAMHYASAYIFPRMHSVENEYNKLKNKQ